MQIFRWAIALAVALALPPAAVAAPDRWIESWGTALPLLPAPPPPSMPPPDAGTPPQAVPSPFLPYPAAFEDQTLRMIVRTSAGGPRFRLEFANAHGGEAVLFGAVHVALAGEGGVLSGDGQAVTFGGETELTLFPGARALSDPVELAVPALAEIAVSLYLPGAMPANTVDALGLMPAYVAPGDQTASARLEGAETNGSYFWLRGLSVPAVDAEAGTIVVLGDSITEGYATTPGEHRSWPSVLAQRLRADPALAGWGVVNAGISGNRILKPGAGEAAVARFTDDVLSRPGVKWVVVLEGINDINMSIMPGMPAQQAVSAQQIIAGLGQLVERAHHHGIRIAGGTILPTKGLPFYSEEGEAMRARVNEWIRTSGRFDAVIDFDAALRDPADPLRLLPAYDPGDHVHPNDAGNRAMADAVDLAIFR